MLPAKQVITRLPPDIFRKLERRAAAAGESTYAHVRRLLTHAALDAAATAAAGRRTVSRDASSA